MSAPDYVRVGLNLASESAPGKTQSEFELYQVSRNKHEKDIQIAPGSSDELASGPVIACGPSL